MATRRVQQHTATARGASQLRRSLIVLATLWIAHTTVAVETAFDDWQAGRESASDRREPVDFVWGATELTDDLSRPLDARVDGFDPSHPLSHFRHPMENPDDPGRHLGLGDPLMGTSWRNRPLHVGWMFGELFGDTLTTGQADQHNEIVGGYRVGWDFDHYWGTEARFAFSNVGFTEPTDTETTRTAQNRYWDANLLYYPWGDSRWRPFASVGMGWGSFAYTLADGEAIDKTLFTFPVGGGVKYFFKNWMALRLTATDNWVVGQGPLNTMHNLSLTADVEMHFGGRRTNYFPYGGSIHMW